MCHPSLILPYRVAYATLDTLVVALRNDADLYRAAIGLLGLLEVRLEVPTNERKYLRRDERRAHINAGT